MIKRNQQTPIIYHNNPIQLQTKYQKKKTPKQIAQKQKVNHKLQEIIPRPEIKEKFQQT